LRVTILGGSAASPNTGAGCSGYLVQAGGTRVVLDLGPGTLPELRRHADFRALDGVVISHLHPDHVLDLLALQHALAYNPLRPPCPTPVWLPPGGVALLARLTDAFGDMGETPGFFAAQLATREYDPASPLLIGQLTIAFAPTVHYIPCWAMRVRAVGESAELGYTADTGPTAGLESFFSGVRALIAEATLRQAPATPDPARGSLTAAEAGQLATAVGAETLILSHLWEEHGFDAYLADAATTFRGRLELARPGLTVSL
jgi:ribonuclease BN (tRNA processing enzyme)